MNKEYKWKEFIIDKAVQKAKRLAHTQELTHEEDIQMAKGAAVIQLLDILPTLEIVRDMITQRDILDEVETSEAYKQWSDMVDSNNLVLDTAFSIAKTIFNKDTMEDFEAMFNVRYTVDELLGK